MAIYKKQSKRLIKHGSASWKCTLAREVVKSPPKNEFGFWQFGRVKILTGRQKREKLSLDKVCGSGKIRDV